MNDAVLPAVLLAALAFIPLEVQADDSSGLAVIGQDRNAVPAESLIGELLGRFSHADDDELPGSATPRAPRIGLVQGGGLPFSSSLVPSASAAGIHHIDTPLSTPLCVIGPDAASMHWLVSSLQHLVRLGAACILVQASGAARVDEIRNLARPVPVHALPFDGLAAVHGVRSVPVLLVGPGARLP